MVGGLHTTIDCEAFAVFQAAGKAEELENASYNDTSLVVSSSWARPEISIKCSQKIKGHAIVKLVATGHSCWAPMRVAPA